jgi:uncharacterized protein YjiS (DUF1127 family)
MAIITITARDGLTGLRLALSANRLLSTISEVAQSASTTLVVWHERACQRRQLLGLSDAALKDFGASPVDAAFEGDKPFWRA